MSTNNKTMGTIASLFSSDDPSDKADKSSSSSEEVGLVCIDKVAPSFKLILELQSIIPSRQFSKKKHACIPER